MKNTRLTALITATIVAASASVCVLPPISDFGYAAAEDTAAEARYTITEAELNAAGLNWQDCEKLTVYAKVTEGGPDSRISACAWLGPEGVTKTSTKRISGRNVLIGNAIQDNLIGLAGSGIYEFPELTLYRRCQDDSEWQDSYAEEFTLTITIDTENTDCELLGIKFDNGEVYSFSEGFSPDNVVLESRFFDVIEKTGRDYLKLSIDHCGSMDSGKYQPASWQALQGALSVAQTAYDKEGCEDAFYYEARAELEKVRCRMLFSDTDTAENPLPFRELTTEQLIYEMGVGINLGNTMDGHSSFAPNETSWQSVKTTKAYIKALHDAGFNTVRIPVTWGATIDRDTYEISDHWIDRVQEIVDYCVSQDMYAIINIHHDGAEQSGWLRVASNEIDNVYEKFECTWRNIAERFKDYDEHLIFESMNEITCMKDDKKNSKEAVDKDTPIIVNLNQIFVNVVRSTGSNNEKRWLAAVAHYANSGNHKDFVLPEDVNSDDPHIMFAAHIYKANTNTTWTYDEVYQVVNGLKMMADKFDVPMYLGEYGNRTKTQDGTETGYNDAARAYFSEIVHRACQTAGVVPVVWDQGYGAEGKYQTGLFTYWDRELCIPLFKSITDAMLRGTYLPNSELNNNWDYTDVTVSPEIIPITSMDLSEEKVTITIGESFTVSAETAPENSNDVVLWSTDNDSVATVSRGIIRGRGIGTTTIRAYTQNGTVSKEIKVTVNAVSGADSAASVIAPEEIVIEEGKSILPEFSLSDGTKGHLTFTTSNPNIVTVSPTGRLFAVSTGVSYITVTADSGVSKTVRVFVSEDEDTPETKDDTTLTAATGTELSIDAVGDILTLKVKTGTPNAVISFSSDNSAVAAVNSSFAVVSDENGNASVEITAMSVGSATVTARAENGSAVSFGISVLNETPSGAGMLPMIIIGAAVVVLIAVAVMFMIMKKKAK
ncbi:MAG: cellulase family glycosylhydrolase [Oscillospiraceae bacterium]|nr:cellulase family glycosylhydrolase [Oscillospiraceae bacterium]